MLFAVDIDRTIAIDTFSYATYISQALELNISQKTLSQLASYWEFVGLPVVSAYRSTSQGHEARFQTAYEEAKVSLEVLTALQAVPFAAEGVHFLTQYGQVGYYTSRLENMHEVTKAWLSQYQFPELPIVSCKNFLTRYLMCYMHTRETCEPVVLIDDNAAKLIAVWESVLEKWPIIGERLPQRFILVAFGCDSVPFTSV